MSHVEARFEIMTWVNIGHGFRARLMRAAEGYSGHRHNGMTIHRLDGTWDEIHAMEDGCIFQISRDDLPNAWPLNFG